MEFFFNNVVGLDLQVYEKISTTLLNSGGFYKMFGNCLFREQLRLTASVIHINLQFKLLLFYFLLNFNFCVVAGIL